MMITFILLQFFASQAVVQGRIDRICRERCEILAVRKGEVRAIDQWSGRNLALGHYAAAARTVVPPTEAPILDLKSPRGWRVVITDYLDHENDELSGRIRFFSSDHAFRTAEDVLSFIESTRIGDLFGGTDEIFVIASNEEHAYNIQSEIWLLPERGAPKQLAEIQGLVESV